MANNDKVPELSKNEFESFIKDKMVLVDFSADWCMPCVMMEPIVDEMSERFKGKIKFGKVNIDENHHLAQKFEIRSIPHFIIFKNGEKVEQFVGAMPEEELEKKLRKFA